MLSDLRRGLLAVAGALLVATGLTIVVAGFFSVHVHKATRNAAESLRPLLHYAYSADDLAAVLWACLVTPLVLGNLLMILASRWTWLRALAVLGAALSIVVGIVEMACYRCYGENPLLLLAGTLSAFVLIPLLVLSSAVLVIGTTIQLDLLRRRSRDKLGVCTRCGYNLFGVPEPRCPECGTPFPGEALGDSEDGRERKQGGDQLRI